VTGALPLKVEPDAAPVPELFTVNALVVFAVTVVEPPKETVLPLTVRLELARYELPIGVAFQVPAVSVPTPVIPVYEPEILAVSIVPEVI
jgi:hypothetical protein